MSDIFCYCKVARAITLKEAIEKSPNFAFLGAPIIFSPTVYREI